MKLWRRWSKEAKFSCLWRYSGLICLSWDGRPSQKENQGNNGGTSGIQKVRKAEEFRWCLHISSIASCKLILACTCSNNSEQSLFLLLDASCFVIIFNLVMVVCLHEKFDQSILWVHINFFDKQLSVYNITNYWWELAFTCSVLDWDIYCPSNVKEVGSQCRRC